MLYIPAFIVFFIAYFILFIFSYTSFNYTTPTEDLFIYFLLASTMAASLSTYSVNKKRNYWKEVRRVMVSIMAFLILFIALNSALSIAVYIITFLISLLTNFNVFFDINKYISLTSLWICVILLSIEEIRLMHRDKE